MDDAARDEGIGGRSRSASGAAVRARRRAAPWSSDPLRSLPPSIQQVIQGLACIGADALASSVLFLVGAFNKEGVRRPGTSLVPGLDPYTGRHPDGVSTCSRRRLV